MENNKREEKVKIVVTVPKEKLVDLRTAMCTAGAGIIGNYTFCSTTTKSIGTFKPNDEANPFIGEPNKIEYVEEERIEVVCPLEKVRNVIKKIKEVHPYEEPAIDIIPLLNIKDFE